SSGHRAILRLYWNLRPATAVRLMELATSALNAAEIPFRLKVVNDPQRYNRCDAGVLYVNKADYPAVRPIVEHIYAELAPGLKAATPAFTKVLAPGLGLAEDPGDGGSFGHHRCHPLAEGIVRAHELGRKSVETRLEVVELCFNEAGISLDEPY